MSPMPSRPARLRRRVRRAILLRRRLLAALLTAAAVLAVLQATRPPAVPSDLVLTAAADLPAGTVLGTDDLTSVQFASGTAPDGATVLAEAVGRTLAAPLREGEPVTDVRLVGPGLLDTEAAGQVAVPVRIPDAEAVGLLRVGDRINLLSTDPRRGGTDVVATSVRVLALPAPGASDQSLTGGEAAVAGGRLVVVAASPSLSELLADAAVRGYLSISLSG